MSIIFLLCRSAPCRMSILRNGHVTLSNLRVEGHTAGQELADSEGGHWMNVGRSGECLGFRCRGRQVEVYTSHTRLWRPMLWDMYWGFIGWHTM